MVNDSKGECFAFARSYKLYDGWNIVLLLEVPA